MPSTSVRKTGLGRTVNIIRPAPAITGNGGHGEERASPLTLQEIGRREAPSAQR